MEQTRYRALCVGLFGLLFTLLAVGVDGCRTRDLLSGGGLGAALDADTGGDGGALAFCGPGIDSPPNEGAVHVTEPMPVEYRANPPTSGNHWPVWQQPWGVYPNELPRERWVHNLEHGGIVLLYNCPDGCAADVQTLIDLYNSQPLDKFNARRFLITPDTVMPHKFAATAWDWRWQGDTLNLDTLRCFIEQRYDKAPESL